MCHFCKISCFNKALAPNYCNTLSGPVPRLAKTINGILNPKSWRIGHVCSHQPATMSGMCVRSILEELIGFPTVCRGENVQLIGWVENYLKELGARCIRIQGNNSGQCNLLASIGPPTDDGIVLSAHSDVVPVDGQPWSTDPFSLTEKNGKLFGRGTSDMKGFLACMLIAARHASQKSKLTRPLHLAVSFDEEIGCVGIRSLLEHLEKIQFRATGCIVGEPTLMHVVTGHKGKLAARICCYGLSAHSANPALGCNAIMLGCDMIREVEGLQANLINSGPIDSAYEVPHGTVQVGVMKGGVAVNIVPDYCEVEFEMRLLSGSNSPDWYLSRLEEQAARLLKDKYPKGKVEIVKLASYPGLNPTNQSNFPQKVSRFAGNESDQPGRINFGTEGGLYQQFLGKDFPVVVCGPGSINRAHKADEYIHIEELQEGVKFLKAIVDDLAI